MKIKKHSNCLRFLSNSGFTLFEILMVVIFITIVSSIAIVNYRKAVLTARTKQAEAQLELIYDAQKQFYLDKGRFAESLDELDVYLPKTPYFVYNVEGGSNFFTATASYSGKDCTLSVDESSREIDKSECDF